MPDNPAATRQLAAFVAASRWDDIPAAVRREGVRSLLNTIGCSLGGAHDEAMELAIRALSPYFGPAHACVIGRKERPDALHAAFLNAVSANVLEYDDTHLPTVMHPAAPVAPPLFALADRQAIGGSHLLHAFILGVEVSCRVGNALMPNHYRRGYHITASCGIFGAAVAAAKRSISTAKRPSGHWVTRRRNPPGWSRASAACRRASGSGTPPRTGSPRALFAEAGLHRRRAARSRAVTASPRSPATRSTYAKISDRLGERLGNPAPTPTSPIRAASCCSRSSTPASNCARARLPRIEIARSLVRGHPLLRERTDRPVSRDRPRGQGQPAAQRRRRVPVRRGRACAQYDDAARRGSGGRAPARQGDGRGRCNGPGRDPRMSPSRAGRAAASRKHVRARPRHAGPADERCRARRQGARAGRFRRAFCRCAGADRRGARHRNPGRRGTYHADDLSDLRYLQKPIPAQVGCPAGSARDDRPRPSPKS